MSITYNQTATAAGAGSAAGCSGASLIGGGQEKNCLCTVGGTGAASAVTVGGSQLDAETSAGVMMEIVPTGTIWSSGNWTVRLNVTTANANVQWVSTYICRLNSSNVSQATIGSLTGQTTSLGTTGVKSHTVSGSSQSPAAGDKVYIVLVFTSSAANQSFAVQFNSTIDSPFDVPTPKTAAPSDGFGSDVVNDTPTFTKLIGDHLLVLVDLDALPLADAVSVDKQDAAGGGIGKSFSDTWRNLSDGDTFAYNLADVNPNKTKTFTDDNQWLWDYLYLLVAELAVTFTDAGPPEADQLAYRYGYAPTFTDTGPIEIDQLSVLETQAVTLTDSWGNLADSFAFQKPGVGATDIPVTLSDAWGTLGDSTAAVLGYVPTFTDAGPPEADQFAGVLGHAPTFTDAGPPEADALAALFTYQPTLTDTWGNLADSFASSLIGLRTFAATDSLNNWTDAFGLSIGYAPIFTDSWNNLADTLTGFETYRATLTDNLNNWQDNLTRIVGTVGDKPFAPLADPLNNWADAPALLETQFVSFTDPAANLADTFTVSLIGLRSFAATDPLNNWLDIAQAFSAELAIFTDGWGLLADQVAFQKPNVGATDIPVTLSDIWGTLADGVSRMVGLALQPTDSWQTLADSVAGFFVYQALPTDTWQTLADELSVAGSGKIDKAFTDSALFAADTAVVNRGLYVSLTDQGAFLADAAAALRAVLIQLADGPLPLSDQVAGLYGCLILFADALDKLSDDLLAGSSADFVVRATDAMPAMTDTVTHTYGLAVRATDTMAAWTDDLDAFVFGPDVYFDAIVSNAGPLVLTLPQADALILEIPG